MVVTNIQDCVEAQWSSGKLTAWLLKRKSGNSRLRVRRYNKRFFTLDFDHKVLFYAHTANSRKVSTPIPFNEIYDVTTLPGPLTSPTAAEASTRRPSLSKRFSLTSGISKTSAGKDGIIVRAKGRFMELICSSSVEAEQWYQAVQAAMATNNSGIQKSFADDAIICDGKPDLAELETTVGGRTNTEEDESPKPANAAPRPDEDKPPPAQHGTLFDLNADLDNGGESGLDDDCKTPVEVETVEERPNIFQAVDLGFEVGESDSDSDGSLVSDKECEKEELGVDGNASRIHDSDQESPSKLTACHKDRHEGLTLQERLAALEFSDDEDEDDDNPLGLETMRNPETLTPAVLPSMPPVPSLHSLPVDSHKVCGMSLGSLPESPPMAPDDTTIMSASQVA
eukprot:gnl/MRDRNA2_/MRDRNA2_94121_c0_seq1.p1 gnl/MRDRNA2_/MRDRNA2_94121_c0~~gnl/MRDRNA2_/MRDRNA2_94121_c0_seq1.p1  ORF type:complete len:396 (+),score=78.65 gnl/MRDRNA2_/MRDRNA2_94121_c0_seq1:75-1262(+)